MFDLVDVLKKGEKKAPEEKSDISSVLFYQTEQCRSMVKEAYKFEGYLPPTLSENTDALISEHVRGANVEIIIVELNQSQNVTQDAERISHLLPNDASVVIVGSEDAISTIRNLKKLGFYYLFWPVNKEEMIDFVKSVWDNRRRANGIGKRRKAKRISVIGSKGGIGTTMITAEVSLLLTEEKHASCIIVDNHYQGGNLDIMLGIEKFEKMEVRPGSLASSLDNTSAQSLLKKRNSMLSVLALTSNDLSSQDLKEYTKSVMDNVSEDANFVIEDFSANAALNFSYSEIVEVSDCLVIAFTPTVASLREAARMKKRITEINDKDSLRMILLLNHVQPESMATVSVAEAELYLEAPIDIKLPYIKKLDSRLLENKRLVAMRGAPSREIRKLASLILGEDGSVKKKGLSFSFGKG